MTDSSENVAPAAAAAPSPSSHNTRGTAARILAEWLVRGDFPDRQLDAVATDHAFVMEMVLGVVRWRRALEWLLRKLAPRPPDRPVRALLLVGLYQLLWMDDVEPYAAVNETVEAAKAVASRHAADFVNAVLRRAGRERVDLLAELDRQPAGVRLSHPDALLQRWQKNYGADVALNICAWDNQRAETVLRLNASCVAPDEFRRQLAAAGMAVQPLQALGRDFFVLPRGVRVSAVPGYREGWFVVQDPATTLAVDLLAPRRGERVLDACAAPGGKALLIAELLGGRGLLVAMDVRADRLGRLKANVERFGSELIRVIQGDAASPEPARQALLAAGGSEGFDALLLDVPCSNTGVLRRRPDARWRFTATRLNKLTETQYRILHGAAALLRPGGRLVYSTCSIEPEENEQLIARWLPAHPEFRLDATRPLLPGAAGTDGAFAALLTRAAPPA